MKIIKSYSDFTINSIINYQGDKYKVIKIKPLTRGLKAYTLELQY